MLIHRRLYSVLFPLRPEIVRFAPSPTGFLHLGGLRTALFNYLLAKKTGGKFILRIEDTDQTRTIPNAVSNLIEILGWAGLEFDEGPGKGSSFNVGPFMQSERLDIYQKFINYLLSKKLAYKCYCSKEKLSMSKLTDQYSRYDRTCRDLSPDFHSLSEKTFVVRLRVPDKGMAIVTDLLYGTTRASKSDLDDIVLMKSDGFPTYHFANVIDDHLMGVTTVMRGAEWLPSTPLHILLYEAFDWKAPNFVHLPLLLNPNGSKLSKRQGSAFVSFYREAGYFPLALLNFVAYLGWTPRTTSQIMNLAEMVEKFDLKDLNKADPKVDKDKLAWFNKQQLLCLLAQGDQTTMSSMVSRLAKSLEKKSIPPSLPQQNPTYLSDCIKLMASRVTFIEDIADSATYLFKRPELDGNELPPLDCAWTEIATRLEVGLDGVLIDDFTPLTIKMRLETLASEASIDLKRLHKACRSIITGTKMGAPIIDTMSLIGKNECIERIKLFLSKRPLSSSGKKENLLQSSN